MEQRSRRIKQGIIQRSCDLRDYEKKEVPRRKGITDWVYMGSRRRTRDDRGAGSRHETAGQRASIGESAGLEGPMKGRRASSRP